MSSIADYIDCPKCGNEACEDLNVNTGEEYINCLHCGYSRHFTIINKPVDSTEDIEWVPKYEIREYTPYGTYKVRSKGSIAYECGAFSNVDASAAFADQVNENGGDLEHAEYTYFDHDTGLVERYVLIQELETIHDELIKENLINKDNG